jgi:hypothetical protein
MGGYKLLKFGVKKSSKIDPKWPPINFIKKWSKIDFYGGGPGGSKLSKIDVGDPGGQNINFLKFRTFLQKLPTFRPPKSTPKKGPIENAIPHK